MLAVQPDLEVEVAHISSRQSPLTPFPSIGSRFPTLGELLTAVEAIAGPSSAVDAKNQIVDICVSADTGLGLATRIRASSLFRKSQSPADADQVRFLFHDCEHTLAVLILERLSRVCGAFVLEDSASGRAVLVAAGMDLDLAVDKLLG